jgi:hypothetical protein
MSSLGRICRLYIDNICAYLNDHPHIVVQSQPKFSLRPVHNISNKASDVRLES